MLGALFINFLGISPIHALIWIAVLYGLTAPVIIGFILLIANNKKIMKKYTNGYLTNIGGGIGFFMMTVVACLLLYYTVS